MGRPNNAQCPRASTASVDDVHRPPTTDHSSTSTLNASLSSSCVRPSSSSLSSSSPPAYCPENTLVTSSTRITSDLLHDAPDRGSVLSSPVASRPAAPLPHRTSAVRQAAPKACDITRLAGPTGEPPQSCEARPASGAAARLVQSLDNVQDVTCPFEGASKGRTNAPGVNRRPPRPPQQPPAPAREPSQPTTSRVRSTAPVFPPAGLPPPVWRPPRRKAVLIGVGYAGDEDKSRQLYAGNDPGLLKKTLERYFGFESRDIVMVTDVGGEAQITPRGRRRRHPDIASASDSSRIDHLGDSRRVEPTRDGIITEFRWLVDDAQAEDELVVLFSGHCEYPDRTRQHPDHVTQAAQDSIPHVHCSERGPCMRTTKGGKTEGCISKTDLHNELLCKVPAGCRLQLILDCCNAAGLVDLPFRAYTQVDLSFFQRLAPIPPPVSADPIPVTPTSPPSPFRGDPSPPHTTPVRVSTPRPSAGVATASRNIAPSAPNAPASPGVTPPGASVAPPTPVSLAPPFPGVHILRRQGGAFASPPPPVPPGQSTSMFSIPASLYNLFQRPDDTPDTHVPRPNVRPTRNPVAGVPSPVGYIPSALGGSRLEGDITMWAATGANRKAFEGYGLECGILVNAFCTTLDETPETSMQDLWTAIGLAIIGENEARAERDRKKCRHHYRQCAELWVSQNESGLDKLVFPPREITPTLQDEPSI